ncbi:MAG TPA: translation initiation factor IF-2 [Fimbriimonadaceae bacterium]|nr:translation initiation factor IF-2 [Fimbriimonadaceae bacterium]HRJ32827.1 translation initiation factor IF-2 [Fimbriimonadaceae bacterium]
MQTSIADVAKNTHLVPGQVMGVLDELGVQHDSTSFEADADILELVEEAARALKGSKKVPMLANRTPRDVAQALGVPQPEVQKTLITKHKVMAQLTTVLKPEVVEQLVAGLGYEVQWVDAPAPAKPSPATASGPKKAVGAQPRPPIVTILGHVDHGKTSLLDYIRKANVASKEAGGITQHIGAYQVELPEGKITFLDTPGHAAFTAMRSRGAQVTDIAILVVAADDGIMPQTIEAISHVKNAGVPMIVAVNKMDKPDANPDRVMQQLTEHQVIPIPYGGDVEVAKVSALTGEGVPDLLELILLQAGIMGLTADPRTSLDGVVIEAKLEKGRGPVATILVEEGTLKIGDNLIVGSTYGKVKAMMDYRGERIKEAGPSTPVEVLGLTDVPNAGDRVAFAADEREARTTAESRASADREKAFAPSKRKVSLGDLRKSLDSGEMKTLNLIVKADVQGSVEAVRGMLEKVENEEVTVKVIHSGVGTITESDILLASAADAICVGFNTRVEPTAKSEAERSKVEIRTYSIIYELIEDIEAAIKGMLAPKFVEEYLGTVEIRMVFNLTKYGLVAGCHVTDGKVQRNCNVRIKRDNEVVWEGKVGSLKNVKQDVREMIAGQDCGIQFDGFTAFKEGDVIEAFEMVQIN